MLRHGIGLLAQWITLQLPAPIRLAGWRLFVSTHELSGLANTAGGRYVATRSSDIQRSALSGFPRVRERAPRQGFRDSLARDSVESLGTLLRLSLNPSVNSH